MEKKTKNLVHHFLGKILTNSGHNKSYKHGIFALKKSKDFFAKCQTADKINDTAPALNQYIFGNPLPQTIELLGVSNNNFSAETIIAEIDWFCMSARKYASKLNIFLNYKNEFENYFLLGMYTEALESINKTEQYIGMSIWAISSKFLVYEYTGQQEQAKVLQSEIFVKNKEGVFTTSLINFISQKSERKLSAYRYDRDVKNCLHGFKSNLDESNKDFYFFYLNFFEVISFKNIKDVLGFDYCNSIIDRYLTFRRVIIYCISHNIEIENLAIRLPYIQKRITDDLFNTITLLSEESFKDDVFFEVSYVEIFDLFYSGLYEEVCEKIQIYILKNKLDFNLLNIYSRSLVLNNSPFKALTPTPSLANEISENIYKLYKRESNPSETLYNLYQISKNVDVFDFNYQLNSFIKTEQNLKSNEKYFFITGKKVDPFIFEFLRNQNEIADKVYATIKKKIPDSLSINYKFNSARGNHDEILGIDSNKINIDKAKYFFDIEKFEESLIMWNSIYFENQKISPIIEVAVDYIYRILSKTEKFNECIIWYVDNVLTNPYLVFKIETDSLHKILKKGRFKNVDINIYLPIFISLISGDENEKSFSIELFCKSIGIIFPSEYPNTELFQNNDLAELFLFYSCNNETLNYYKHLNTTKKRLDERINICTYLAKYFKQNKVEYTEELNLLTNELIIHEGTQKLDESKIYANDQAILNKELDEYEGLYNRYITIAGLFLKDVKVLTINKNDVRFLNKKGDMEYSQNEIEYSKDADLDAYYKIFSLIREKFLYSKFGIVTYLSTRIRHGVLLGELRPELEKNNLIFYKNKLKNSYEPNSYWLNNPNLTDEEKKTLINIITKFSSEIDALINSIIKQNIQIKVDNENEYGWFDYEFNNNEHRHNSFTLFYEESFKEFCKKVLEILWVRTDKNLNEIRTILQNEVKTQFVTILNNFDAELHTLLGKNKMPEIFTALTACSTNIQTKIDKIALWFKRSGKAHSDFQIGTLVDIICKHVQKAHPQKILNVVSNYQFDHVIKGEFYEHFSDIIRILIENMLKHTNAHEVKCIIELYVLDHNLIMVFENENKNPHSEIIIEDFGDGATVDVLKLLTEGKSGIMKARKTVKDDLRCDDNEIIIDIKDEKFRITVVANFQQLIS